jgi:uncharacterized protein YjbI with pentapeptide repeats
MFILIILNNTKGFSPDALLRLKRGDRNLEGVNLENADLRNINFCGTNFKNANLKGVLFRDSSFNFVNFEGATLIDVDFRGAFIECCNFNNVKEYSGVKVDKTTNFYVNFQITNFVEDFLSKRASTTIEKLL